MNVNVEMTAEEFLEFMECAKDKGRHEKQILAAKNRVHMLAQKVDYAVEPDPKKPGKYKIVDQNQMDDLYELAHDILS